MTDRELLEAAAKAAGMDVKWLGDPEWEAEYDGMYLCGERTEDNDSFWNPLRSDGDALRLAVKLNLQVTPGTYNAEEASAYRAGHAEANDRIHYLQDLYAATRRAIVRAAAEIGAMTEAGRC